VHVIIATVGTRGDVQPYVAIGQALVARGHRVTVATHVDHRELVETHGLAHRPVCGSFRELMASDAGRRWLESGDSVLRYLEAFRALFEPLVSRWLDDFDAAFDDADAALVHVVAAGAILAVRRRGIPMALISPYAAIPSREFVAVIPRIPLVRNWLARAGHAWMLDKIWGIARDDVRAYYAKHGVPVPGKPVWRELVDDGVPHLHLWSEHLAARPKDWPACAELLGYCFLDAPSWTPPPALAEFLDRTPAPIYVGFGSMTGMEPKKLATLTREALRKAGVRAVVAMGWGGLEGFETSDDVLLIHDAPHDRLFPRVSAVVHHCGAGTTAAALRAGRPSVAVPFFGDQPHWAYHLALLGAAPPPIPRRSLTADRLAEAIRAATSNPEHAARAEAIGAAIRAEDGAVAAAERALRHFGAKAGQAGASG
jgi:sterol 3beta-glucosyltransferase